MVSGKWFTPVFMNLDASFVFSYLFSCFRLGKFRDLAYMIIGAIDVIYLLVILIF